MLEEVLKNVPKQEPKESGDVGLEDASTGGTSKYTGGKQKATKTGKEESKEPTVKIEVVIEDTSKVGTSKSAGGKQKENKPKSKADK